MDIKDLNKAQLILLALLFSFVTSIATGIITVTLMQQAPESVTVPINRVIRQTVEKIQQVEGKVETVVVKEEDLVVDAIASVQSSLFTLTKEIEVERGETSETSAGFGIAVNDKEIIVADSVLAGNQGKYFAKNASGKFRAELVVTDSKGFSFLKLGAPVSTENKLTYTPAKFGDLSAMKVGQKFIVFGNVISSFIYDGNQTIAIPLTKSNAGGPVLNLDGEVLGISLFNEVSPFASSNSIEASLEENSGRF